MSLLDYIRGNRRGKAAHDLEKKAMTDPFLSEAMEGFEMVDDDHMARIAALQKKLGKSKTKDRAKESIWMSISAAAMVAIICISISHLVSNKSDGGLYAQSSTLKPISIYIPEAIYTENIAVIATKNTQLTRNVSVRLMKHYKAELEAETVYEAREEEFKVATGSSHISSTSTSSLTIEERLDPIEVYMPTALNAGQKRPNEKPEPLVGLEAYNRYLQQEIRHPDVWPCVGKKGKVLIEFSVDKNGSPYDIVVEYGLCGASDDEAVRLVKEGPKWTPSNRRGQIKIQF